MYKAYSENFLGRCIRILRSDNRGKYIKWKPWYNDNEFCTMANIQQHLTTPYTPKQNGIIEQKNVF